MVLKSLTFCFSLMILGGCSPKQVSSDYDGANDQLKERVGTCTRVTAP